MQKNVLTVVAVAGSCAVFYILYRLKIFSEKNCSSEAKDKTMGKSNHAKLNGTRENIVYGKSMVTKSSLDIKSEDVKYNSHSKSVKKSNAIQLHNVSTSQSELEYTNDGSERNLGTTTIYPINFDIKNSNAESYESRNNLSNGGISSPMPSLQILNNSLDERDIYDADNEVKYLNLDVNENRSPEDRFDYYIKSNDVDIPNKNSVDSSSSCSNLSISPEFTNSIGDKIQHEALFQINEINSENLNLDIPESLDKCIVDAAEHLSNSNLECDYNVPNSGAEELNAEEISKSSLSNIETLHSNLNNCDNSSNLELNSLGTDDCMKPQSCTENLKDNHSNVSFVNEKDKVNCTSEIHSAESIVCNCDQKLNLNKNLGDLNINDNENQTNSSVNSKVKKSRRRRIKSNKPILTDDSAEARSCSSSQSSQESSSGTLNTESEAKPRNLSETSVDCGQSWTDEHSNGSSVIADNNSMADFFLYQFDVPQTLVGRLIGKKGNFLNKVKAETDTKLVVIDHEFDKNLKVCCVEGEKFRVLEAIKMIREHFPCNDFPELKLDPMDLQNFSLNRREPEPLIELTLPFGFSTKVEVTFLDSTAVLWLRQHKHQFARDYPMLCIAMNDFYGDGSTTPVVPMPIERNTVCVCRLSYGNWARCKVLCHANINAKVQLIDSGEVRVISMINLRPIVNPNFTGVFIQAEKVYLYGLKPFEGSQFCNEGLEFLKQFIKGKPLRAVMHAKCSQEPCLPLVKLYAMDENKTEIYINEMLVEKKFARVEDQFSLFD